MSFSLSKLFTDPVGAITGLGRDALSYFGSADLADILAMGGAAAYSAGLFDNFLEDVGLGGFAASAPLAPPVGYQGGIPQYTAVRQQIPQSGIATPRPGASGQRYFTDVIYAQKPDTPIPTLAEAQQQSATQAEQLAAQNPVVRTMAAGGLASLGGRGYYLGGTTDGMADRVPARIDGRQEARLSDGEFVIPADVVSHLGNGNSNAGAQQLYDMMDRVRKARTGRESQGTQINPSRYMPGMRA